MGEGINLLDVVYNGGRLLALASFIYFLYLMFRVCNVLNVFSMETLRQFTRPAGRYEGDASQGSENGAGGIPQ